MVASVTLTVVDGVAPKSTAVPVVKPVPVTVTDVPPPAAPSAGVMTPTAGTGS